MNAPDIIGRGNPAQGVHIYSGSPNWTLLTVTTENRTPWLASHEAQQHLEQIWLQATAWLVNDYLLMPDHLHCFCAPHDPHFQIEQWIQYWKSQFRKAHGHPQWRFQSRGWHHRLRSDESYSEKWLYVQENPVRRKLVTTIDQWPFKGRVHEIRWSHKR